MTGDAIDDAVESLVDDEEDKKVKGFNMCLVKVDVCHKSEGTCRVLGQAQWDGYVEDGVGFKRFFALHKAGAPP